MSRKNHNLNAIISDARDFNLDSLPSGTIRLMMMEAKGNKDRLTDKINNLGRKFNKTKKQGNFVQMEKISQEILSLRDKLNKVKEQLNHIEEAYEQKVLDENVLKKVGSEKNVMTIEYIIFFLTLATLCIIAIEMFFKIAGNTKYILDIIDTVICIIFIIEFFWRMNLSLSKWWYFKRNWLLLIASLPLAGILQAGRLGRFIQFERLARLTRMVRFLRLLRIFAFFWRGSNSFGIYGIRTNQKRPFILSILILFMGKILTSVQVKRIMRLIISILILIIIGGIILEYVGDISNQNLADMGQSIWWSFTTVITGGFANIYNPQHLSERVITIGLVLIGLILTSALTGSLASILMEDNTDIIERHQTVMEIKIDEITIKLKNIEDTIERLKQKKESIQEV